MCPFGCREAIGEYHSAFIQTYSDQYGNPIADEVTVYNHYTGDLVDQFWEYY